LNNGIGSQEKFIVNNIGPVAMIFGISLQSGEIVRITTTTSEMFSFAPFHFRKTENPWLKQNRAFPVSFAL